MSKAVKAEIVELRNKEKKLLEAIAKAISKRERMDDDRLDDKAEADRLRDQREKGEFYDQQRLALLNSELTIANAELLQVRKNIQRRRSRLQRVRRNLKKQRVRFRNSLRPKIIDLDLGFRPMATQGSVDKVIGHYTAGPQDENTEDAIRLCRIYHQAHLNQGWSGEAYMLCFTVEGDILLLRPAKYVGAHTLGYNTGSYGIMMHGTTGDNPTAAQKKSLQWWAKNGSNKMMGSGRTTVIPGKLKWYGHNDFNPTSCPGNFKPTYRAKGKA